MSAQPQEVAFDLASQGFATKTARTLLTTMNPESKEGSLSHMALDPFSVYMGAISK